MRQTIQQPEGLQLLFPRTWHRPQCLFVPTGVMRWSRLSSLAPCAARFRPSTWWWAITSRILLRCWRDFCFALMS